MPILALNTRKRMPLSISSLAATLLSSHKLTPYVHAIRGGDCGSPDTVSTCKTDKTLLIAQPMRKALSIGRASDSPYNSANVPSGVQLYREHEFHDKQNEVVR